MTKDGDGELATAARTAGGGESVTEPMTTRCGGGDCCGPESSGTSRVREGGGGNNGLNAEPPIVRPGHPDISLGRLPPIQVQINTLWNYVKPRRGTPAWHMKQRVLYPLHGQPKD